jgi:hypothetical protein
MFTIDLPLQQRGLAFAITFRDRFLPAVEDPPIRAPLEVEALGQRAFAASDGTYRISVVGAPPVLPVGTFPVTVRSPGGEYRAFDPIEVTLPLAASVPPQRSDYLLFESLWPTRLFPIPRGETAVIGVITQQGIPQPGLSVRLHESVAPLPDTPEARTDAAGEFVYRFPFAPGAASPDPLSLNVTVLDGITAVPVTPAAVQLETGLVHTLSFLRP